MSAPRSKIMPNYIKVSFAAAFAAATCLTAVPVNALDLGVVKIGSGDSGGLNVGVRLGRDTGVNATVGGSDSVASVDARVTDSVSASTSVLSRDSALSVDANVRDTVSASASVGGNDRLLDTTVSLGSTSSGGTNGDGGGNNGNGTNGNGTNGDGSGNNGNGNGTPTNGGNFSGGGMSLTGLNALGMPRMEVSPVCGVAGNFNAINGVAVFAKDGTRLGIVVGAYTENNDLVGVRVLVDANLALTTNCVEYSTNGGTVRPDGIVLNTTVAMLVATLGM